MKLVLKSSLIVLFIASLTSCEELLTTIGDGELTQEEVVKGLKTALELGTDSATNLLHATNGYYKDEAVKILLPEEAQIIYETKDLIGSYVPGFSDAIDGQIENVVLGINRAAESAANDAKPIFVSAITDLSLADAWDILQGSVPGGTKSASAEDFDSTAATSYFKLATYDGLVDVFSAPIDDALDSDLGLGFSANSAWDVLTSNYNTAVSSYNVIANNPITGAFLNPLDEIHISIAEHATAKALDGLFLKVGNEEVKIRRNPLEWAIDIIQKVFTWVEDQV